MNKQKLGTFVLGGIAGVLAGILLAPKSGKELRGSIASRAGEARERSRETYFEAQEKMQERVSKAREYPAEESPDPLATLGPEEPIRAPLRDVADTDDIRRRIEETRSRLRARLEDRDE